MPRLGDLWDFLDQIHRNGSSEDAHDVVGREGGQEGGSSEDAHGEVGREGGQEGGGDDTSSVEMPQVWTPNNHIADLKAVRRDTEKWKRRYSEENGKEYFENMATGDTSWDLPAGAALEEEVLPPGWERRYSTKDKKHYFTNEALDKSVWDVSEIGEGSG